MTHVSRFPGNRPGEADESALDVRKFSFSQRTINIWNNLSTDCVHASSVNMFKNKIDKYLVKAGYTYYKGRVHLELLYE